MTRMLLIGFLAAAIPAAATASPRTTLRLENNTLLEAARKLESQTGIKFVVHDVHGAAAAVDEPDARRATSAWNDVPVGKVVRDLSRLFAARPAGWSDQIEWYPQPAPTLREYPLPGVALRLKRIEQHERLAVLPGQAKPDAVRSLDLLLAARSLDGDRDRLGDLTDLVLIDDAGGRHPMPRISGAEMGLPDERQYPLFLEWRGKHARRIKSLTGKIALAARAVELRFRPSAGGGTTRAELPPGMASEGVTCTIGPPRTAGGELSMIVSVSYRKSNRMVLIGRDAVHVRVQLEDGTWRRINVSGVRVRDEDGTLTYEYTSSGSVTGAVKGLEVVVPLRSAQTAQVPFRIENVALPFGK
jgi:hypothetical protein